MVKIQTRMTEMLLLQVQLTKVPPTQLQLTHLLLTKPAQMMLLHLLRTSHNMYQAVTLMASTYNTTTVVMIGKPTMIPMQMLSQLATMSITPMCQTMPTQMTSLISRSCRKALWMWLTQTPSLRVTSSMPAHLEHTPLQPLSPLLVKPTLSMMTKVQ